MADEKFKLPGSSYEELTKIIKAYGQTTSPAGPADVARLIGVHETIVSRNNAFLVGAGIVEGGRKKAITPQGETLARALDHNMAQQTAKAWRTIVEETEFLARLVTAVRIRDGMEEGNLQSHVAYTAGQPNKGTTKTGSATVTEILKVSGLLSEEDGKLVAVRADGDERVPGEDDLGATAVRRDVPTAPAPGPQAPAPPTAPQLAPAAFQHVSQPAGIAIQLRVEVKCSVDELPQLREELVALLTALPDGVEIDAAPADDAD